MKLTERVDSLCQLGDCLEQYMKHSSSHPLFEQMLKECESYNPWFTHSNQMKMLENIRSWLSKDALSKALEGRTNKEEGKKKKVATILAGNIPAVGFHDVLCILLSGHKAFVKLSSDDKILIPFLMENLLQMDSRWSDRIEYIHKIFEPDAVIATGSNNSGRYFEYYFSKYPHIIRKSRNSVAVLSANESKEQLSLLAQDVFDYFGMGCRSVSKLYVPKGYDFNLFFESLMPYEKLMQHSKYMNNYDYYRAIYLLNKDAFLTNNFLIVKEDASLNSPLSVLHYEYYTNKDELTAILAAQNNELQCVVSEEDFIEGSVRMGTTQCPSFTDYADDINTLDFLSQL
ncbi:MAG TPA: acyl-CoA reductase [Bacteroidia bacterium]|nr:acyl-CoA reductase [Bacteroidia bacterium]